MSDVRKLCEAATVEELSSVICRAAVLVAYPDADERPDILEALVEYFSTKCAPEARAVLAIPFIAAAREGWPKDRERVEVLEAENKRLREALEFYAKPEVYAPHPHGPAFDRRDLSFAARAALAATPGGGDGV